MSAFVQEDQDVEHLVVFPELREVVLSGVTDRQLHHVGRSELGYTSPARLAIEGGSNGGLLMGAALTQRPDLFRAVVAHVGIYDMIRVEDFTEMPVGRLVPLEGKVGRCPQCGRMVTVSAGFRAEDKGEESLVRFECTMEGLCGSPIWDPCPMYMAYMEHAPQPAQPFWRRLWAILAPHDAPQRAWGERTRHDLAHAEK